MRIRPSEDIQALHAFKKIPLTSLFISIPSFYFRKIINHWPLIKECPTMLWVDFCVFLGKPDSNLKTLKGAPCNFFSLKQSCVFLSCGTARFVFTPSSLEIQPVLLTFLPNESVNMWRLSSSETHGCSSLHQHILFVYGPFKNLHSAPLKWMTWMQKRFN